MIKKVFAHRKDAFDYVNEIAEKSGLVKWTDREEPDIDYSIARIEVRAAKGSDAYHYFKIYQMEVKGI